MPVESRDQHAAPTAAKPREHDERDVVSTRVLQAPRALVFKAWTAREHAVQWWRPKIFESVVCEAFDVRPGGTFRFRMRLADGTTYTSHNIYREITPPERLVYDEVCDENGKVFHRARLTVTLEEVGRERTLCTVHARLELVPERDPRFTLEMMRQGWTQGWKDNFDLLVTHLASLTNAGSRR
jgi:uncharacterized protein YndB with AHSA1/START domain